MTGAQIVSGSHALFGETDVKLGDGEEFLVSTTRIVGLETPGHTPESMSYAVYVKDAGDKCWGVFTGDALFVGDTGRTDLPDPGKTGENAGILYDAIHRKIAPLGDQTLLFPAHGAGSACGGNISERDDSTLGIEKETNPVFSKSRQDFVETKLTEKMARPPYFQHMEKVNLLPGRPLKWPSTVRVLQPAEFNSRMKEGLVIDSRSPEAFAAAHIPCAYNIWLEGLPAFGGWVCNENTRIFLVTHGPEDSKTAVLSLARIGIDTVDGILANGMESWRDKGLPLESITTTNAAETASWMQQGLVHILDVRDEYEWDEKRIPGAVHAYVGHLEEQLPSLPKDSKIVVHCNVGHRSGLAASILKRNGFTYIHNMLGGITAWEKLGLPLEGPGTSKKAD
ncbi:MAG: rhodanese-like domain-containing protein [Hydrogenophaga sp.]|nr:rhodanese-like domain-containing protein [Hydrogenophaga sp.]